MRLDRNINPDGRGKYALLNLRTNKIEWGTTCHDEFFVLKLKDKFAAPALVAYANAITVEIDRLQADAKTQYASMASIARREADSLEEYKRDIKTLAAHSMQHPLRRCPD